MFKKYYPYLLVAIVFFSLGHIAGVFSALYYKFDKEIIEIKRYHSSWIVALSYVPLKHIEEERNVDAKKVLIKELVTGINLTTEYYDDNDEQSKQEILDMLNKINSWLSSQKDSNNHFKELKASLSNFTNKHNKSFNSAHKKHGLDAQ